MFCLCDDIELVRAVVRQEFIEILPQPLVKCKADSMCKRRGNQADCKCAPDAIDDAGGHIDDHAGNDDRPDLHHLQKCHVQNAGEGHVAAQIRFQRLLIAAAQQRNDIRHRLPHHKIDQQQRHKHKKCHDAAADKLCFFHHKPCSSLEWN